MQIVAVKKCFMMAKRQDCAENGLSEVKTKDNHCVLTKNNRNYFSLPFSGANY